MLKSGSGWNTGAVLDCTKNMLMQRPDIETASSFLGWQTVRREDTRGAEGAAERRLVQRVGQPGGVVERGTRRMGEAGGPHQGQSLGLRCHGCGKQSHIYRDCHIWCFSCGSPWHLRCECTVQGNGQGGGLHADCPPPISALRVGESGERGVLVVAAVVEGKERRALVDTGCTHMLVDHAVAKGRQRWDSGVILETMDRRMVRTQGGFVIGSLVVEDKELGNHPVQVVNKLPLGVDLILGLDIVIEFGMQVTKVGGRIRVSFRTGEVSATKWNPMVAADTALTAQVTAEEVKLSDTDYKARFDKGRWIVRWKWKNDQAPPNSHCHNMRCQKATLASLMRRSESGWNKAFWCPGIGVSTAQSKISSCS